EPQNLELDHNETYHAVRKEEYHSSILDLIVDGKPAGSVLLRAVQWHPYKQQVLHVDFQRVSKSERITTKVPLHFINGDISPAVKLSAAVITHPITEIEITCLPADLPQAIEVDLAEMVGGAVLHVSDVKLPEGVALAQHGDVNPVVANAQVKGGGADTSEAAGEESAELAGLPRAAARREVDERWAH